MNNTAQLARARNLITNIALKFYDELIVLYSYFRVCVTGNNNGLDFSSFRKLHLPNWYHNFSAVGFPSTFYRIGGYDVSQKNKAPILIDLIREASALVKKRKAQPDEEVSLVDLFCADAYYSIYALHHDFATFAVAIDCQEMSGEGSLRANVLEQANFISKLCGLQNRLLLINEDVLTYRGEFDICLCFGGLYHINNPYDLLKRITLRTKSALVIQTVITSNQGETRPFFISPAPDWSWGCRFNAIYLTNILQELGWKIIHQDIRSMEANTSSWDNLSLSILCVK